MYRLYHHAVIHTLDPEYPVAEAILVSGDRIIHAGRESDFSIPGSRVERIDLQGRHVFPGFIDCHTHVAATAQSRNRVRLDDCRSRGDALNEIRRYATRHPERKWVLGGGWNANIWQDGSPDREVLDRVVPDRPAALYNKDCHTQWLNSPALKACGFRDGDEDPPGGRLGRTADGKLNGLVYEKACHHIDRIAGSGSSDDPETAFSSFGPDLHALGITGVHSCEDMDTFIRFQQMERNHALPVRICMHPPAEAADRLIAAGWRSGFGNEWLRMGGLKYFVDGSLGSLTAEMFAPYTGLSEAGISVLSQEALTEMVLHATDHGLSATIHAIGDKANHKTLNALEAAAKRTPPAALRHRIEHAQILDEPDLPRFGRLGVTASMQPLHISDDVKLAEKYLGERTRLTYPVRSLIESGCRVVFGSDMPVADPDPLKGIAAAVGRKYDLLPEQPSWQPREVISPLQALAAYTREAAWASYEEQLKGTLEQGKLADFIVTDRDFTRLSADEIPHTRILMTVIGGRAVFQDPGFDIS